MSTRQTSHSPTSSVLLFYPLPSATLSTTFPKSLFSRLSFFLVHSSFLRVFSQINLHPLRPTEKIVIRLLRMFKAHFFVCAGLLEAFYRGAFYKMAHFFALCACLLSCSCTCPSFFTMFLIFQFIFYFVSRHLNF